MSSAPDVRSGAERTLDRPVHTLSPEGRFALTNDFARIQRMRPGYGYAGLRDPHRHERAPVDSGVWRLDLETGASELVLSLAEVARIPQHGRRLDGCWHYFNHLLVSPDSRGRHVAIDSPHAGSGRQLHLVDLEAALREAGA